MSEIEMVELPQDVKDSVNFGIDISDEIMRQSLEFARNEFPLTKRDVIPLAVAHAQIATSLLIARERTDALTFALENLGSAISDVALALNSGKDAGAALFDIGHTFSELLLLMRGGATDTRTKREPLPKITRRKA